ncbi:MAG: glycoside hydrolase family 99-like domain-containing protein [Lentisphaeria bacterium]|nr:glycoside hydrolase family 99-like domain-containing protein [Lentisphaeria bacterium]
MQLAAYYFPNYHVDPRNEKVHGPKWTEWELMKHATPRFPGHRQPRVPLWGYQDEADPAVMAQKIDAAANAGIDAFVFDWYWYDGPYLERALDEGFLQAPNRSRMKFALMWANHDWTDKHPVGYDGATCARILYPWTSTKKNVGEIWEMLIRKYFTRPEYWRVDGKPYFSIYATNRFIKQMGGPEATREVLEDLQTKAKAAGLPGIHVNGIWFDNLDSQPFCVCPQATWTQGMGFHSYTSYNNVGCTPIWQEQQAFPTVDFRISNQQYMIQAKHALETLPAPYYPVATTGWDSSPRTIQSDVFRPGSYPFFGIMDHDSDAFLEGLTALAELLSSRPPQDQLLFIHAWNEWTEGSYLEPDTQLGTAYLDRIAEFRNSYR